MFNKIKKNESMHANMFCCAFFKVRPGIAEEIYLVKHREEEKRERRYK